MKKLICLILLALPVISNASEAHKKMWMYIDTNAANVGILFNELTGIHSQLGTISQKIPMLDSQVAALTQKISQLESQIGIMSVNNKHHIGDEYRGGLVFYVDESQEHGLIASKIDVNGAGVQWRNGQAGNKITNARGDGIGAGETNTRIIISQQTIDNQNGKFAALLAANFQVQGDGVTPCKTPVSPDVLCYGGWYLPSAYELQLLHNNLHLANASTFAPEFYWSSTEANVSSAWLQNFSSGEITAQSKANTIGRVRAISRF